MSQLVECSNVLQCQSFRVQGIVRSSLTDRVLVRQAKEIVEKPEIVQSLIAIENSYENLIDIIFKLEWKSSGIMETIDVLTNLNSTITVPLEFI